MTSVGGFLGLSLGVMTILDHTESIGAITKIIKARVSLFQIELAHEY